MAKISAIEAFDRVRARAYLKERGLEPDSHHQLDLIFPEKIGARDDLRHIPNDCARACLFFARNRQAPRQTFIREALFHYNEHISLLYTGIELRAEDDEVVWLQLLKYGQSVPLGRPFKFELKHLVRDVIWQRNGESYNRARECLSRLRANELLFVNSKAYGKSGTLSLIANYVANNDADGRATHFQVCLDPNLILLFAGNTFTNHKWETYCHLAPVARRLADYIESHRNPYPLALDRFKKMCGSTDTSATSWRQTVRNACEEVQKAGIATRVWVEEGQIWCLRDG